MRRRIRLHVFEHRELAAIVDQVLLSVLGQAGIPNALIGHQQNTRDAISSHYLRQFS